MYDDYGYFEEWGPDIGPPGSCGCGCHLGLQPRMDIARERSYKDYFDPVKRMYVRVMTEVSTQETPEELLPYSDYDIDGFKVVDMEEFRQVTLKNGDTVRFTGTVHL